MSRFRLLIEYDGTRYHGWQQNAGVKTVQGEMIKACESLFNSQKIELYGAGRTDAGVHALGQVAHLDAPTQMYPEMVIVRLNEILPYDIHVLDLKRCNEQFHARHDAIARSYVYSITRRRSAFGKHYAWWVKEKVSVEQMQNVASLFKGFHDFSSFGAATNEEKSTQVKMEHISVNEAGDTILIHLIGSHFLWNMVRRMVGVIVHAGKNKTTVKEVKGWLERHSERPSQLAAPASGLYLERVYYSGEAFDISPKIPFIIY